MGRSQFDPDSSVRSDNADKTDGTRMPGIFLQQQEMVATECAGGSNNKLVQKPVRKNSFFNHTFGCLRGCMTSIKRDNSCLACIAYEICKWVENHRVEANARDNLGTGDDTPTTVCWLRADRTQVFASLTHDVRNQLVDLAVSGFVFVAIIILFGCR